MYIYSKSNKKFYTTEYLNYLVWAYSAICAGGFAFFLALLGASSNKILFQSNWIQVSIFFYALSIASSLFTLMTIINYRSLPKTLYRVFFKSCLSIVGDMGVWASIVATFCFISYFSLFGAIIGVVILSVSYISLKWIIENTDFDEEEIDERVPKSET